MIASIRSKARAASVAVALCTSKEPLLAQRPAAPVITAPTAIQSLVQDAVRFQMDDFHHTTWGLRYRVHRSDGKEDTLRDLVESVDGNVARTIRRNGQALTPEQEAAEIKRLQGLTSEDMARRRRGAESTDRYGLELLQAMPTAMIYTAVQGQPQLSTFPANQVVLDFAPNPSFHPASTTQSVLPGLAGRVWIDGETRRLDRIELRITRNLNVMMGLLFRVYEGGTLTYEQRPAGGGHYAYNHVEIDVRLRELMVKVVPYHSTLDASEVVYLPTAPRFPAAVDMLLNEKNNSTSETPR